MTAQLRLFDRKEDGSKLRRAALRGASAVVDAVGPKIVAPELDMGSSQLRDSLAERERHHLTLEQFFTVLAFDDAGLVLAALCEATGHEAPVRKRQLDDTEKLERLLRSCAKAGPAGQALVEDAFGPGVKP
jgi:hypothetical protein